MQACIVRDGEEGLIAGTGEGRSGIAGCGVAAAAAFLARADPVSLGMAREPAVSLIVARADPVSLDVELLQKMQIWRWCVLASEHQK